MSLTVGLLKLAGNKKQLPIVLLPAFPFDLNFWKPVAEQLSPTCFIANPPGFLAPDFPTGESKYHTVALKNNAPSLADYASAVLDLLQLQGVERFVVAGCSMGGYTSLAMLNQAPEQIAGLGLFDTNAQADSADGRAGRLHMAASCRAGKIPPGFLSANQSLLSHTNQNRSELLEFINNQVQMAPLEALAWAQQAMATRPENLTTLAKNSHLPTVVARGTDDEKSTVEQCQEMATVLGVKVLNIPGAGHLLPIEQPEKIVTLLEDLVRT